MNNKKNNYVLFSPYLMMQKLMVCEKSENVFVLCYYVIYITTFIALYLDLVLLNGLDEFD